MKLKAEIEKCNSEIMNGTTRCYMEKLVEIDLIDNTGGHRFACEMSIFNKDAKDVALKHFDGDTKLLTTKDKDSDSEFGYTKMSFGRSGIYMDARALARCARENNISY